MVEQLTVMIPTYNRKDELLDTLLNLQKQTAQEFLITISDNASDYSIIDDIYPKLNSEFRKKITLTRNKHNIGQGCNLTTVFNLCNTKWGWMLGDDDIIFDNSVETILNLIKSNDDVGVFWYPILSKKNKEHEICMSSMEEFIKESKETAFFEDFIYLSNKVYNMDKISNYIETAFAYAYTAYPHCIPILEALKSGTKVQMILNKTIVKHPGYVEWNYSKFVLGSRTILDYNAGVNFKSQCDFVKFMNPSFRAVIGYYLDGKLPWNYKTYLKSVYHDTYAVYSFFAKRLFVYPIIAVLSTKSGHKIGQTAKKIKNSIVKKNSDK